VENIFVKNKEGLKEEIERRESYKDLSDTELDESLEKVQKKRSSSQGSMMAMELVLREYSL